MDKDIYRPTLNKTGKINPPPDIFAGKIIDKLDFKIAQMTLNDGDTIVLKHPKALSAATKEVIANTIKQYFDYKGKDIGVIILEEGMELAVINNAKATT